VLTVALVIGLSNNASGAAEGRTSSADSRARELGGARVTAPENCPGVRKAVRFYQRRYAEHRAKMGAPSSEPAALTRCPRYVLHVWVRKAAAARKAYERWLEYHWHWQEWLPDKFARVGACETGYGKRPGSWTWDSGTYVSAFGIYRPAYAQFARYLGLPTWDDPGRRSPREQYLVARAIQQRYSWSAWGCGSA